MHSIKYKDVVTSVANVISAVALLNDLQHLNRHLSGNTYFSSESDKKIPQIGENGSLMTHLAKLQLTDKFSLKNLHRGKKWCNNSIRQ